MNPEVSEYTSEDKELKYIDKDKVSERIKPIDGLFSPGEEIKKIRSFSKEERTEALEKFKDKLSRQRRAWALCRTTIENTININPDISKEVIMTIIEEFASLYGFTKDTIDLSESIIDDYIEMHNRVKSIREKYPNDQKLIKRLTGKKISKDAINDFEIEVGPASIDIMCNEFNLRNLLPDEDAEEIKTFKVDGYTRLTYDKNPIYYSVVRNDIDSDRSNAMLIHETEHQKNRFLKKKLYNIRTISNKAISYLNNGIVGSVRHFFFKKILHFERYYDNELYYHYEHNKDVDQKTILLQEFMTFKREEALNSVKDEFFAKSTDLERLRNNDFISGFTTLDSSIDNPYDYLKDLREYDKKKDDSLWQETVQRILVDEYIKIINDAKEAFYLLLRNGFRPKESIAILADVRLQEWPKTVKRLLDQGEGGFTIGGSVLQEKHSDIDYYD